MACASKLNLVDLAGSERFAKTGAEGGTAREAMHINKSLTFLEQVRATAAGLLFPAFLFAMSGAASAAHPSVGLDFAWRPCLPSTGCPPSSGLDLMSLGRPSIS